MRITDIQQQKRNQTRRSVFLDGAFAFGVSEMTYVKYRLSIGDELDALTLAAIKQDEAANDVKNAALRYRSFRPRTRKEMIDYLRKKEYADEEIEIGLAFLEENKLLNDAEFARMYCRDAMMRKPMGERALRQKLMQRGIARDIIDAVIAEQLSPESDYEAALATAQKLYQKFSTSRKQLDDDAIRRRLFENLARRGFSGSVIQQVIKAVYSS
ncbi:MAG TPA: RecX family transcriptional regulator [Bacteroidota bacterium]|nr:RecX family transcriptional regulator [Bacteroidota bacterium]